MNDSPKLAIKIAQILEAERPSGDFAAIFASLEKINHRLDKLEAAHQKPPQQIPQHASQEKFSIVEAIVDELFASKGNEKACTFEPNARPCDNCSMCSSRGF
ncbi:MAG: hypothetical protein QUS14_09270 [Pyrinomonadaceae bacterium]|nr:hypothetical protein [Pyrinomonadaceae bacterium]